MDISLDDINDHRQVLERLRRGDEHMVPKSIPPVEKPSLQRTDSDERRFQQAACSGVRQYGSDSQPIMLDDDYQQTIVAPEKMTFERHMHDYAKGYTNYDYQYDIYVARWHPERLTTQTTKTKEQKEDENFLEKMKKEKEDTQQQDYEWDDYERKQYEKERQEIRDVEMDCGRPMKWDDWVRQEKVVHSPAPVADTSESELQKGVVDQASKERGKFRVRNKMIALTYPQCDYDKEKAKTILEGICSKWGPNVVVAQEQHHTSDGLHLHAFIQCDQPLSTRDERFFDIVDGNKRWHPNISVVKCSPAYMKYITKSDKQPATTLGFNIEKYVEAKENKKVSISSKIVEAVREGATLRDIRNNFGGFMLLHQKQVADFISKTRDDVRLHEATLKWKKVLRFDGETHYTFTNAQIAGWLNDHLLIEHKFRGMNLWVKGPTKCGKTSLVQNLINLGCQVFTVNNETEFFDGINDDTQLIVFDEFKAQKKITTMNGICDGHNCRLNIKGGTYEVNRPIPVLILSNFTCQEAYHKSDQEHLKTLLGRFIHVEIKEGEHISITTTLK